MRLPEVLGDVGRDAPPVEVTALAYDHRKVEPGTLFFCVPGFTRDGHDFAPQAVAAGAVALVVERPLQLGVPEVAVPSVRAAMAPAAARFHGDPTAALEVVGVTGTNGKTTTCFLLRALLEAGGRRTGMLGTVANVVGGRERAVERTTPEAIELQRTFREMLDAGDSACAMEVSSHALALGRADAIHWAVAIFTNLTQDHLDFHETMEDYFAAKRGLFEAGPRTMVVNVDDAYGQRLAAEFPQAVTIGVDNPAAQLRATDVDTGLSGSSFRLESLELRTPLPGRFNVVNVLGAVAAARALGVDDATMARALPDAWTPRPSACSRSRFSRARSATSRTGAACGCSSTRCGSRASASLGWPRWRRCSRAACSTSPASCRAASAGRGSSRRAPRRWAASRSTRGSQS
jgi:UDP-N-acetylmuramoyl-L-alanyl-D-glutamate--2,6-diaminopimelate ligase